MKALAQIVSAGCLLFLIVLITGCASAQEHLRVVERLSNSRDCAGAERYTRESFSGGDMYMILGEIAGKCRGDKRMAIEYWKMCARGGHPGCKEVLISAGGQLPEETRPNVVYVPQPVVQQPQNIIIQQPAQNQTSFNPAACIQDGGATFCPKYKK